MTVDQIRNLLTRQPFQPFIIHLADGRNVRVPHYDWAIISPSGRTMIVYEKDGSFTIVDIMLATTLEVGPPPASGEAS